MFEIAHYLGAPDNILFIIANELWPCMQNQTGDSAEKKAYKEQVRYLARPFLCSPKHLLHYLQINRVASNFLKDLIHNNNKVQLSFVIIRFLSQNINDHGWYTHNNTDWYMGYQFCSLEGIEELITYLNANDRYKHIDLSGHMLETFSCDMVENIVGLNLSGNQIEQLTGAQLKYTKGYLPSINLDNNPISRIDESFFQRIYRERTIRVTNSECYISLKNNLLTAKQKKKAKQKFYEATHTLPERYITQDRLSNFTIAGGILAGTAASLYTGYTLATYMPTLPKYISEATSALAGGMLGIIGSNDKFSLSLLSWNTLAGCTTAYLIAHKLLEKAPRLAKVIPGIEAGVLGAVAGACGGAAIERVATNKLARLTHPHLKANHWNNWYGCYWNIEL